MLGRNPFVRKPQLAHPRAQQEEQRSADCSDRGKTCQCSGEGGPDSDTDERQAHTECDLAQCGVTCCKPFCRCVPGDGMNTQPVDQY